MTEPGEVERFYDRASALMRALLTELATAPDQPRPFPEIEDALGWPRRDSTPRSLAPEPACPRSESV